MWSELLDQALLGTAGAPTPEGEWAGMSPEQVLLKQAALGGIMRRAGFVPEVANKLPPVDPAPPEKLAVCSAAALQWLKRLQQGNRAYALISDWCLILQQRQERVPHALVAHLLSLALRQIPSRPYILPVTGERGRWVVERDTAYADLRPAGFWTVNSAELEPTQLAADNTHLLELRDQMMEGLAHE